MGEVFGTAVPARKKGEKLKRSPELFAELKGMVEANVTDKDAKKEMMRLIKCFAGKHGVTKKDDPFAKLKPLSTWPCFQKVFSMVRKGITDEDVKLLTAEQTKALRAVITREHIKLYDNLATEVKEATGKTNYITLLSKLFSAKKGEHPEVYEAFASVYEPMRKPLDKIYRAKSGKDEAKAKAEPGGKRLKKTLEDLEKALGGGEAFEKAKEAMLKSHKEATAVSSERRKATIAAKNAKVEAFEAKLIAKGVKGEALKAQVKEYKDSLKVTKGKSKKDKEAEAEESEVEVEEVAKPKAKKASTKKATPMFTLASASERFLMMEGAKKTLGMLMWAKEDCPGWEEGPIAERPHTHVLQKNAKGKAVPMPV
jgi:hypothetical protein